MKSRRLQLCGVACTVVLACAESPRGANDGPPDDMSIGSLDGGPSTVPCDNQLHRCADGEFCFAGKCLPDNGHCSSDEECENDTWCDCTAGGGGDAGPCSGGVCLPWGIGPRGQFDPACTESGFTPIPFDAPKLKCSWNGADIISTPLVADLDGDGKPEIVAQAVGNQIVALHAADCTLMFQVQVPLDSSFGQLAVGDLDGDRVPEIVALGKDRKVLVLDNHGKLLASSGIAFPDVGTIDYGGPAIADVDGKAPAEILAPHQVLRYSRGNNNLTVLWSNSNPLRGPEGWLPLAADLDGDGRPEVVEGRSVFDGFSGADKTPPRLAGLSGRGAFAAVGDLNGDGRPDLVLVQNDDSLYPNATSLLVWDVSKDAPLMGPIPFRGLMGPPTVADFDGDRHPDIGTAGTDAYRVFTLKCWNLTKAPCDLNTRGLLWSKRTQDSSSGITGSSVFDFNGDGRAEVVYRDECWLRVYNGPDGKTLFATSVTSVTALELPVVADVDSDGHADIVVSADKTFPQGLCSGFPEPDTKAPFLGQIAGIYVYQDPMNRWRPSRGVWNQHTYHVTNINDDLSVPAVETNNWLTLNNYRQNVQGVGTQRIPVADVTVGRAPDMPQADCNVRWTLRANLCNRGSADLPAAIPASFYAVDPRRGSPAPICTAQTLNVLSAGQCEVVSCDWLNPPQSAVDLWVRGNDDGTGAGSRKATECKSGNDLLILKDAVCRRVG